MVTAAAFAANGSLEFQWVLVTGIAAAIIGDNTGYWIGKKGGLPLVVRYGHRVGLHQKKLERIRTFYAKHGSKTVLVGRFIAVFRSWAAVLAGVMHMSYARFVAFNAAGCVAWATVYATLGFLFGKNLPVLERYSRRVSLVLVILAVAGVGLYVILRRRRKKDLSEPSTTTSSSLP